jgi:hypothetical protein
MKSQKQKSILILIFFAITGGLSIIWYTSQPQGGASAGFTNTDPIDKAASTSQPELQNTEFPLSATINDKTVEVEFAKITDDTLEIGVCYPTLDNGDWYPTPGSVTYESYEILPNEFEFTSEVKADGKFEGSRCATIRYLLEDTEKISTPITFNLIGFWAVPRETSACANFEQRFSSNVKAREANLEAKCSENDKGEISASLTNYDNSLQADEAQSILDEIIKGEYIENWEFTINEISQ